MDNLVIVIGGPPGAGSSTVAKAVAKKLGMKFFSAGDLHKSMFKGWKNKEAMAALEVWKTKIGSSEKTHRERDELIRKIAKEGDIVICTKLGIHFLADLSTRKIWLDAPLSVRAKRTAKRDKVTVEDALKQISLREDMERISWKKIYGFDYFDQKNEADLVIDTSKLTVKKIVDDVLNFVGKR